MTRVFTIESSLTAHSYPTYTLCPLCDGLFEYFQLILHNCDIIGTIIDVALSRRFYERIRNRQKFERRSQNVKQWDLLQAS